MDLIACPLVMMNKFLRGLRHSKTIVCASRFATSSSAVTGNGDIKPFVYNRNPRNLERMRIAYKPSGYHLEKPGREYWHKLEVTQRSRYVTASLLHCSGKKVVEASTNEWAIRKYLYRCTDTAAYINLGRLFAQRCLESGISSVYWNIDAQSEGKIAVFLAEVEKTGLSLIEPSRFHPWRPWDLHRPEKPWEVTE